MLINMKRLLYFLFFIAIPLIGWTQTVNPRKEAEKMNQRAQIIYYELHNNSVSDSLRFFRNVMDVVDYSMKSDEYDRIPDKKGSVKLRYAENNHERLATFRPLLIDAGLYLTSHKYRQDGINAWKLYIKASQCPLLKDDKTTDETSLAAFYVAQAELYSRNYKSADRFADIAMQDDDIAQDAAEIKARCMHDQMVSHEDSVKYLSVLAALYKTEPQNKTYFAWIMQFYSHENNKFNLENFIDEQLQASPNSPTPWLLKGETAMHAKRWNEAADAYRHADKLSPNQIPIIYNIGVSLMNWSIDILNASNKDDANVKLSKNKRKQKEKETKERTDSLFSEAESFLLKVKAMDPHREKVDWVTPLYQIYSIQGDADKADELRPLLKK